MVLVFVVQEVAEDRASCWLSFRGACHGGAGSHRSTAAVVHEVPVVLDLAVHEVSVVLVAVVLEVP